jgi:hypothetical protein
VSEGVLVTLSRSEALQAAYAGVHRMLRAIFRGRQPRHGRGSGDEWHDDVQACAAEMAVAKALDRFWSDSPAPDYGGDVGELHVRHTTREDGRLILRPSDPDEGTFVLVTGSIPAFRVVGWITGRDGKAGEPHDIPNGRPPCWMVPQSELRPIEELQR